MQKFTGNKYKHTLLLPLCWLLSSLALTHSIVFKFPSLWLIMFPKSARVGGSIAAL